MNAVEVASLDRSFGPTRVLTSLDLSVAAGDHIAITGPNGSGKTTLLRVLAGLLRPTRGRVSVLGGKTDDPATRERIGFISHVPPLYPRLTAFENIRFWAAMYGDASAAERGHDLLAHLGLEPEDRRPVSSYSQGMRQRVSVVRALCTSPQLVIADEPFAGLDTAGSDRVQELLSDAPTVVLATHDAQRPAHARRFVLRDGRLHPE